MKESHLPQLRLYFQDGVLLYFMKLLPMFKRSLFCFCLLLGPVCSAQVLKDGYIPVEEGVRVPSTWGVSWPYDGGFAQVLIQDGKFTLVFLDADRRLRRINNIELALVHARQVGSSGQFSPFHLQRSSNGLYFQNPRHVYEPHHYDVKVDMRKVMSNKHRYRMKRSEKRSEMRYVKASLEVKRLDQRDWSRSR